MIENYEIVCSTWLTNVVNNRYYPVSYKCLESFSNTDFVDRVLVANGNSTDDTVEKHNDIDKVEFFESPNWDTEEMCQVEVVKQLNSIINKCSDMNKDVILLITCGDAIFTEDFREELKIVLTKLANSDCNFVNLPVVKVVTKDVRETHRALPGTFYTYSAIKFTKDIKWKKIGAREVSIIGNKPEKRMSHTWKNQIYMYETWFFTQEDLENKIKNHFEWDSNWSIDDVCAKIYRGKLARHGVTKMRYEDHPKEGQELIDLLNEEHMGHSLFGMLRIE